MNQLLLNSHPDADATRCSCYQPGFGCILLNYALLLHIFCLFSFLCIVFCILESAAVAGLEPFRQSDDHREQMVYYQQSHSADPQVSLHICSGPNLFSAATDISSVAAVEPLHVSCKSSWGEFIVFSLFWFCRINHPSHSVPVEPQHCKHNMRDWVPSPRLKVSGSLGENKIVWHKRRKSSER